ncbi:MAG: peptidase U32 [Candidatus Nealsonbacteria bacterium CG23_combo_of_CG06-09_8_20_14_all_39_17]|uniref:Peptidase U32 n=1 Tax=Candidatus Nealsonbacteria bacterium CG23_combo_of_CG06-09_8_20_14_all_39_17 TaxID=1974722 RepID=A0A2G9YX93_9BACT|nr:MAG: peptidase U32 [Candidatus Nealsonbacteria bacterium CG23_combo_of_CG06-09_8_20_14_all_39_17]PIU43768.1 MAG: peptidase U32 [Candidatus Nealsonbacteria bacterium CG07_land_8_20_14_0_80_39_13]
MNKYKRPEIMSPIGDWAGLEACKDYADAVYFGVSDLSMRARANFLKLRDLGKFTKKCRDYKLKNYLTLNSTLYNKDIKEAEKIVKAAKAEGVDSLIVWDPATIEIARKENMNFTISTQANISNWKTAEFYKKLDAKRIVLARELNLKQIKEIKDKVSIEIETFVHGAMCLAISGRCIISAYIFGKSANCGYCSQPCRKEWFLSDKEGNKISNEGKYFLNSKDLCMIEYIPELIKAGIDSFKIEGRKRDPKYVETTARCYKEAVDSFFEGTFTDEKAKEWKKELEKSYNRGFSTGFYFGVPGKEGINYDKADNVSLFKKEMVGKVVHYYPKAKAVSIKAMRDIKIGNTLIIEGEKTFLEQKIDSMQINGKDIKKAKKGEEFAIKTEKSAKKNDNVFMVVKRDVLE